MNNTNEEFDVKDSTNIKRMAYDKLECVLYVEFQSEAVYKYSDVSSETWKAFKESESKGKYFRAEILGKYTFKNVSQVGRYHK